jgi:hypothetical protein
VNTSDPVSARFARRKPWLGGILGFLFPGLGHLYVGRATAGLLLLGACYGLSAIIVRDSAERRGARYSSWDAASPFCFWRSSSQS